MNRVSVWGMFLAAICLAPAPGSAAPAAPRSGGQAELICESVQADVIETDGFLDDWEGVAGRSQGAPGSRITVRCNVDPEFWHLSIQVEDDTVTRRGDKQDEVALVVGGHRFTVRPAHPDKRIPMGGSGKRPPGSRLATSLLRDGWAVELAVPREDASLGRGYGVAFGARLVDVDGKRSSTWDSGFGVLVLPEARSTVDEVLRGEKIATGDIRLDVLVDVDGEPGLERVIVARHLILGFGEGYAYAQLPLREKKDLIDVKTMPLEGGKRHYVVVHYVERGKGGARDVLAVFAMSSRGMNRIFAHEVGKRSGANRMMNTWRFETGKRGMRLLVEPGTATGFTQENFREIPATDMQPILLPWGAPRKELWVFQDGEAQAG